MKLHGKLTFSWNENQMTIDCKGPFNAESLAHYGSQIKHSVLTNVNCKDWQRLEVWDDESLASPEGLEVCESYWDWCNNNGCAFTAIVVSNAIQIHLLKKHISDTLKTFKTINQAQTWLDQKQQLKAGALAKAQITRNLMQ